MTAAACLVLAFVHLFIWVGQRDQIAHLTFFVLAVSVAAYAAFELAMMLARSPAQFAVRLRWIQLPIWVLVLSLVWFTRTYLHAGRRWLGWCIVGVRSLALLINFSVPVNVNYRQVTSLKQMMFLGEPVAVPVGVPSLWMLVPQASFVLLAIFLIDASIRVWRRGERRRALIVGGSMTLFAVQGPLQGALIVAGVLAAPLRASVAYLLMLMAMGYELSRDMLRAALLARRLHESEQHMELLRESLSHIGRVSMMGQLASALAHELNQPLGAILRNAEAAEMVLQQPSPDLDELRAIVTDIQQDDRRAGDVIDRLRGMLKRRDIEMRPLELEPLIMETAALLRTHASARQVKLTVQSESGLAKVWGDRIQLQQVLLNLLLNAMDAVKDEVEQRRVVILQAKQDGARTVEVAVTDQGHGIAPDRLAHVFDPFFTTKPEGMGMGLPISRTIIQAHGGQIWAESNDTRGTTFRFTLKTDLKDSVG